MAEAKAETAAPSGKKSKLLLIVIILLVLLLGLGAFLVYFVVFRAPADGGADEAVAAADAAHAKPAKPARSKDHEEKPPIFDKIQDDPFTVNLSGDVPAVLQVVIVVELATEEDKAKLKNLQPKLQAAVVQLLGSKTLDEVKTSKGQQDLAREIRKQVNTILEVESKDEGVLSVSFTKYFYQQTD